ncbi:hypothetical protein CEP54_015098 [Fusarium duplospermum]|uniref:Methyltransferase n=1 Tax=Fusarium duplospermum TaxID=1325734 RepID=A0A428NRI9_9HYPO|nr:hypothetical protein CEP54_015098 [Fusarium duplospermum]
MTTSDEPIRTNEDTSEGWVLVEASTASPGPPEHREHEGDSSSSSSDSGFGSCASSTESIASSICDYHTIHHRKYHSHRWDSGYCFPIDQQQLEAQESSHFAARMLLEGELHLADLRKAEKPIQRVLDVGSGKGYWAIEFADDHPDMKVIGTDLSPIGETWVAPNLCFQIEDCRQDWTFDDSCFDFIHMRDLVGSIKDWLRLFRQAFRCTSPGGLVESHEHSFVFQSDNKSIEPKSALGLMGLIFMKAGKDTGYSFTVVDEGTQRKLMEEAGFAVVKEEVKRMPISKEHEDPKLQETSLIACEALLDDLDGRLLYITTQVLRWPIEETHLFAMEVRKQLKQMDVYVDHRIVVGQKPLSSSD